MSNRHHHPYKGGAEVDWAHGGPSDEGGDGNYLEREKKMLAYLEKVTTQPELEQKLHLEYILKKNANTEYLREYGMDGATDVDTFKSYLPVVDYEAYRDSVERIANGDQSPILSADPPVELLVSSGTTSGDPKLFPVTHEDLGFRALVWSFLAPTLGRAMPSLREGKYLNLIFCRAGIQTPCGLPTRTSVTSFLLSAGYKTKMFHPIYNICSPSVVHESPDINSALYCHILCGLLDRYEIRRIGGIFATIVVKALRFLEEHYEEILEDIITGSLSKTFVQDEVVRAAVLPLMLEKGVEERAELAKSLRKECVSENGRFRADGIIPRLWPNCQVIDTCGTGAMKAYLPFLSSYSDDMRLVSTPPYWATEGFFGVNMNPSLPPESTFYILVPTVAYYEFIPVTSTPKLQFPFGSPSRPSMLSLHVSPNTAKDQEPALLRDLNTMGAGEEQVLDLVSLEVGQQYELIVTTISGYCRLRVGDILEVVGSYNNSPMFKFVRRKYILLSVDRDKTDEEELQAAVRAGALTLEKEMPVLRLSDYTSYTSSLEEPGHYVIVWELRSTAESGPYTADIPSEVLDKCCQALEASFNFIYREGRYEGIIGPLELVLVLPGTFELLYEHAVSLGASLNQYKVPRGLGPKQAALSQIVKGRINQRHFSSTKPPFIPSKNKKKQRRLFKRIV